LTNTHRGTPTRRLKCSARAARIGVGKGGVAGVTSD